MNLQGFVPKRGSYLEIEVVAVQLAGSSDSLSLHFLSCLHTHLPHLLITFFSKKNLLRTESSLTQCQDVCSRLTLTPASITRSALNMNATCERSDAARGCLARIVFRQPDTDAPPLFHAVSELSLSLSYSGRAWALLWRARTDFRERHRDYYCAGNFSSGEVGSVLYGENEQELVVLPTGLWALSCFF